MSGRLSYVSLSIKKKPSFCPPPFIPVSRRIPSSYSSYRLFDVCPLFSRILSNLEGTVLKCVVAKKEEERDTAEKIFEILLNRFGERCWRRIIHFQRIMHQPQKR